MSGNHLRLVNPQQNEIPQRPSGCVLIFCTRPELDEKPLDAVGGSQFQVPKEAHWDYRPGMNNSCGQEFTTVTKPQFDVHEWSRVELLADAAKEMLSTLQTTI